MAKILDLIYRVKDEGSASLRKIKGGQDDLTKSVKQLATGMATVGVAVFGAKKAYDAIIQPLIDYNKAIKDASEATGMGAEDLSRFIQVGDDFGVSMEAITKALEMATKKGFQPSIASLAELADKGNAMGSATDRAAYYSKIFGRNWAELNPILERGGAAIRELAAAQDDGLAVTEEEIRQSEALRLNLDALSDSYTSLRNTVALKVIPVLADFTRRLDEGQGFYRNFGIVIEDKSRAIADVLRGVSGAADQVTDSLSGLSEQAALTQAAEALLAGDTVLYDQLMRQYYAARDLADQIERLQALLEAGFADVAFDIQEGIGGGPGGGRAPVNPGRPKDLGIAGGRQAGGTVGAGKSYIVGEAGPEVFMPGASGAIAPNMDALARSINHMVASLPMILRDAVAKA